jgi:hypothetical protein
MGPHENQIVAAPGPWLLHVRGCSRSVAAPGPWLLQVRGCSRSVAALLLVSWLLDSWLLDSWLLVYLRTVRHPWEQINTPTIPSFIPKIK